MTVLLTAHSLSKAHGSKQLFKNIQFTLKEGQRVGLIGPNGAGKSTLIKVLAGLINPDEGHLSLRQGLKIGYASQAPQFEPVPIEELLAGNDDELLVKARVLLGKAEFVEMRQNASELSGGWKKRLDIVRALMEDPDLLLLDEPTNHLDLEGILWLERFLKRLRTSYLVISHDRYFLEEVTNEIIELNPCYPDGIFVSEGNMTTYLKQKQQYLEGLAKKKQELKYKVREEKAWLNTSPKARTTKSRSRILQAYELMDQLENVQARTAQRKIGIDFSASERETRKLLVAKNIGKALGGKQLFQNLDLTLSPGTRLGLVGQNGTGKTTLLKLLARQLEPDCGTIKYAEDLQLVYFDQHREKISEELCLREALSPTGDFVKYRGQEIHVNGWAQRFLFESDRLNLPVSCLSGGEKARLLIAKLMLQPADILFLDEPTNDLDIQTLEVIEESLNTFPGAVVLISHDRCLMDRVCTSIIGLGVDEEVNTFADYKQWESFLEEKKRIKKANPKKAKPNSKKTSLSYKEKQELGSIEEKIHQAEKLSDKLTRQLEDEGLEFDRRQQLYSELAEAEIQIESLFHRWQELLDRQ